MSGNFKKQSLGLMGFTPEVTQGTPNWSFKATGGSGTTITVNTTAGTGDHDLNINSAANDFFNGLNVYFLSTTSTALLQGQVYTISDFAVAAGTATFTVDTMAASPASGDLFYVFSPLQASNVTIEPKTENLPRDGFERQTLDPPSALKGLTSVSGSFQMELPGLTTTLEGGATATYDRYAQFLEAIGARSAVVGTTVSGAGSTTTVVDVTDASGFSVGDHVMISGQARRITDVDTASTPDNITLNRALSAAPADTTVVYGSERFTPDDSGHESHTLLMLRDDLLVEGRGCVFNVSISGQFGQVVYAQAEFDGELWDLTDSVTIDGQQSSKKSIAFITGEAGFSTTELFLNSFEFNLNNGRTELRDTNLGNRFFVTERAATCGCVFRNTGVVPKETWEANGTQATLLIQVGNSAGSCICVSGNAQIQDPATMTDVERHSYYDVTFGFVDDQTDFDSPNKPEIIRF